MKNKNIKGTLVIALLLSTILLCGYQTGITGVTQKPGSTPGCTCHALSPTVSVNVSITGPDTLVVNQEGVYTISISGGPLAAGGTDIAVSNGTLTPETGSGLRSEGGELTHISPKTVSAGTVIFTFRYKAPAAAGNQTIYANGNSVNHDGTNSNDQWNFAPSKTVVVKNAPTNIIDGINPQSFELTQNYPNPFNPSTKINFSLLSAGHVKLSVYNTLGDEIAVLVNEDRPAGNYTQRFDAVNFSSGIYFYKLTTDNNSVVRKMTLLK